ncbi:MAG: winged helix DNA-binding domain-containing protein [Sporichthyaceae bacterium]|nr:winged helix DNA-binding domain-containing protein [Sporichthyaceae bacterium]
MNEDGLRLARWRAQLLHRPDRKPDPPRLIGQLLAVQAQDLPAARLALRVRARELTAAAVNDAIADRSVVRTWGPRGTLHLVTVEDLAWLVPLFGPYRVAGSLRRLAQEGVTGTEPDLLRAVTAALSGQGPLTKAGLGERLATVGVHATGQGIVHLAALGAFHGRVVHGPEQGSKPTYVHAADWLGQEIRAEPDAGSALAELARRYLRTRGPAEPADLAAWSGLPLRDAKTGFAGIAGELDEIRYAGGVLHRLRAAAPESAPEPAPGSVLASAPASAAESASGPPDSRLRLLPAFDEYLLSWRSRDLVVPAEHARAVHPGGGIIRPTVAVDGRVVGTWRLPRGQVVVDLFDAASEPGLIARLDAERADVARFLG